MRMIINTIIINNYNNVEIKTYVQFVEKQNSTEFRNQHIQTGVSGSGQCDRKRWGGTRLHKYTAAAPAVLRK